MNNHLRIPVTPHVWKYIWNQYGPGDKFDLASSRQNALRIALTNVSITAESIPSPERLPGKHLYLDLGKSGELKEIAHLSQPWLKSGYFFQHEFNQALRNYIEAQRDLAKQMGLPKRNGMPGSGWSPSWKSMALRTMNIPMIHYGGSIIG